MIHIYIKAVLSCAFLAAKRRSRTILFLATKLHPNLNLIRIDANTGDALNHPFITGAPFYPRYASMQAADFDPAPQPDEEKDGSMSSKSVAKYSNILFRLVLHFI